MASAVSARSASGNRALISSSMLVAVAGIRTVRPDFSGNGYTESGGRNSPISLRCARLRSRWHGCCGLMTSCGPTTQLSGLLRTKSPSVVVTVGAGEPLLIELGEELLHQVEIRGDGMIRPG